jgi:drug/metabolite transporter (DMT)-like permease
MLLPHWGGLARSVAGLVLIALTALEEGVGPATAGLLPFILALAFAILALSAVLAWLGVARPDIDVIQFVVRWRRREKEVPPISIGASVLQFFLAIATIPAVKIFPPSVLYQPEIGPSTAALLAMLGVSAALGGLACLLWYGRIEWRAPAEQQREAEEHG